MVSATNLKAPLEIELAVRMEFAADETIEIAKGVMSIDFLTPDAA